MKPTKLIIILEYNEGRTKSSVEMKENRPILKQLDDGIALLNNYKQAFKDNKEPVEIP